jgi:hypothetical protein
LGHSVPKQLALLFGPVILDPEKRVSISLFNSRHDVIEAVDQTIKATNNDRALRPILMIVEGTNSVELSEIKLHHILETNIAQYRESGKRENSLPLPRIKRRQ